MALQATFTANFEPWDRAVKNASENLQQFEFRTKGVQRQLQTMFERFDGSRVIREATLLATAIEKVGGASNLTEKELRQANATIQEALDKYHKLGIEAPAVLQKMGREMKDLVTEADRLKAKTNETTQQTSLLGGAFKTLGPLIAGAFAVSSVEHAVRSFIQAGSAINDLSLKTGVGTTRLQEFKFAAEQNGNTLDQITGAITQMGKRLTEGKGSVVGAVQSLGLSMQDLRAQSPEDAFTTIADAIAKVPDPMRQSALAMQIFGKSGAEILPTIKGGMSELAAEAHRLGLVLSEESIKAADDLGDAWDRLTAAGTGVIAQVLAPLAPLATGVADALAQVAGEAGNAGASIGDSIAQAFGPTQYDQVQTITKGIIQFGEAAVLVAETVVRGWEGIRTVVLSATTGIVAATELAVRAAAAAELATGNFGVAKVLNDNVTALAAMRRSLDEQAKAAAAATTGNAGLVKSLDDLHAGLVRLEGVRPKGPLLGPFDEGAARRQVLSLDDEAKAAKAAAKAASELAQIHDHIYGLDKIRAAEQWLAALRGETDVTQRSVEVKKEFNRVLNEALDAYRNLGREAPPVMKSLWLQTADLTQEIKSGLTPALLDVGTVFKTIGAMDPFGKVIEDLGKIEQAKPGVPGGIFDIGKIGMPAPVKVTGVHFDFGNIAADLVKQITAAFAGGGDVGKTIGSVIGGSIFGSIGAGISKAMSGIGGLMPKLLGAFGSALGPLGSLLGGGVSALFGKLFGPSKEARENKAASGQIAEIQQQLLQQYGSLAKIKELGDQIGVDLAGAWGDQSKAGLQHFTGLVDEFNAKLKEQEEKIAATQAAVEKYGLTWEQMGGEGRIKGLTTEVTNLLNEQTLLTQAGYDQQAVLKAQADAWNELLAGALRTGTEIPDAMAPILEQLEQMGLLTDENRAKLLGLADPIPPVDWQGMQSAAEKYGITLDSLGPRFQQAKLSATADEIMKDFNLLTQSGADVGGVLQGMSDEISGVVQQAIKFGSEVPAAMQPLIEELIRSGQLLDENGEKITDIGQIKFAKPVESQIEAMNRGFDKVVDAITKLTNKLLGLPDTAEDVASSVQGAFDGVSIDIPVTLNVEDPGGIIGPHENLPGYTGAYRGGRVTRRGVQYLATGGNVLVMQPKGTDTVPAMLSPGEFVVSAPAAARAGTATLQALNAGQSVEAPVVVNLTLNANVHAIDRRDVRDWLAQEAMPEMIDLLAANTRGLRTKLITKVDLATG